MTSTDMPIGKMSATARFDRSHPRPPATAPAPTPASMPVPAPVPAPAPTPVVAVTPAAAAAAAAPPARPPRRQARQQTQQPVQQPPETVDTVAPGQRRTRQRGLITDVLAGTDQLLTAQQVHRLLLGRDEPVGLATVYRTLTAMADAGEVDTVRTGQEWSYRRCSPTHHHHLTCRNCGRTVEITAPPLEQWAASVASEHNYTDVEHVIEISGLCPSCQK